MSHVASIHSGRSQLEAEKKIQSCHRFIPVKLCPIIINELPNKSSRTVCSDNNRATKVAYPAQKFSISIIAAGSSGKNPPVNDLRNVIVITQVNQTTSSSFPSSNVSVHKVINVSLALKILKLSYTMNRLLVINSDYDCNNSIMSLTSFFKKSIHNLTATATS